MKLMILKVSQFHMMKIIKLSVKEIQSYWIKKRWKIENYNITPYLLFYTNKNNIFIAVLLSTSPLLQNATIMSYNKKPSKIKSKNKNELKLKKRLMTLKYTPFTVFYAFLHNIIEIVKGGWFVARSAFSQLPKIKSKNKNELKMKKRLMTLKHHPFTVFYAFFIQCSPNRKRWVFVARSAF